MSSTVAELAVIDFKDAVAPRRFWSWMDEERASSVVVVVELLMAVVVVADEEASAVSDCGAVITGSLASESCGPSSLSESLCQ